MKKSKLALQLILCSMLLFLGCSTTGPKTQGKEIPFRDGLQQHPQDARALLYRNEAAPQKRYTKFIIDPVQIYKGADHGFGNLSTEDLDMMANFIPQELKRVIGEKYAIVEKPGPDTMRIKLIMVGLEKTNTAMRSLTYGNPMGLAVNLGNGVVGREGMYLGSITLAGEFEDAETDLLIAAFIGKIHPVALDLSFTPWAAAKNSVTRFSEDFRDTVEKGKK